MLEFKGEVHLYAGSCFLLRSDRPGEGDHRNRGRYRPRFTGNDDCRTARCRCPGKPGWSAPPALAFPIFTNRLRLISRITQILCEQATCNRTTLKTYEKLNIRKWTANWVPCLDVTKSQSCKGV